MIKCRVIDTDLIEIREIPEHNPNPNLVSGSGHYLLFDLKDLTHISYYGYDYDPSSRCDFSLYFNGSSSTVSFTSMTKNDADDLATFIRENLIKYRLSLGNDQKNVFKPASGAPN